MLSEDEAAKLKPFLEELLETCDFSNRRQNDPVEFVWQYERANDREVVALLTSCLAYGRVELLKEAVSEILKIVGPRPAERVAAFPKECFKSELNGFVYRMTDGADVLDLLSGISNLLNQYGSLERAYDAVATDSHLSSASKFVQLIRSGRQRDELVRGFRYLLPDPADGSTCKRLHLFFRWMGRGPDGVDPGVWSHLDASELIMPLDTHTSRLCRYIGLTQRKSVDGKMAAEVTESLAMMDADDPLKYDFALCHLGISKQCIHERSDEHCPSCPIEPICTL